MTGRHEGVSDKLEVSTGLQQAGGLETQNQLTNSITQGVFVPDRRYGEIQIQVRVKLLGGRIS